jgi:hypothetical protein
VPRVAPTSSPDRVCPSPIANLNRRSDPSAREGPGSGPIGPSGTGEACLLFRSRLFGLRGRRLLLHAGDLVGEAALSGREIGVERGDFPRNGLALRRDLGAEMWSCSRTAFRCASSSAVPSTSLSASRRLARLPVSMHTLRTWLDSWSGIARAEPVGGRVDRARQSRFTITTTSNRRQHGAQRRTGGQLEVVQGPIRKLRDRE